MILHQRVSKGLFNLILGPRSHGYQKNGDIIEKQDGFNIPFALGADGC